MSEYIKWSTNVNVQNGPTFALEKTVEAEAYEKLQVEVEKAKPVVVNLLPTGVAGKFLLIKANMYADDKDAANKKLAYAVGSGADQDLAGPLVLTNAALLSLLGTDLTEVTFKNSMDNKVTIDILVGRDAGPK